MAFSIRFKIFFYVWLFSIPVFGFWWANFCLSGDDGFLGFVMAFVGLYAYIKFTFLAMDAFEKLKKRIRSR